MKVFCVMAKLDLWGTQEGHKEHTVYTLRFSTGYGRGCGLNTPGAGVQVRSLLGLFFLHEI